MDKRLLIALLLTAIVVAVTPIIFPTPRRAAPLATSVQAQKNASSSAGNIQSVPGQIASSAVVPVPDSIPSGGGAPFTVAPQITTISTARSTYQFTNMGAAPAGVSFDEYRNLSPVGGAVNLRSATQPLLRYSLVFNRDTIALAKIPFQLKSSGNTRSDKIVTYQATVNGIRITISYDIVPDRYVLRITGKIDGVAGQAYLLVDLPSTLPVTERDSLSDLRTLSYSFKPSRDHARGVPFAKLDPGERRLQSGPLTWAAVRNKYFVVGLINPVGSTFEEMTLVGGPRTSKIATAASATVVKAVKDGTFALDMYVGPQQSTQLLAMGRDFDHVNPYGWSFLQPVVNPIAALCLKLLLWVHDNLKLSYGWVLVIFGVFIRIALWPLNQSAMRSSMKMQEIQPKLAEVQSKYKDKPEKQREEMMRVYKEAGASPFTALSGCLPMLIPMPVLFALFFVFQNTIEFRGVPFLWLTDISIKDPIYILPVLMGLSMYVLSWIGLRNAPPNPQAKMMSYMFPVMMTFVLANMASGLNLYYTAQNIAALPQQWFLARERLKARKTG